jgi:hypothetical protein
MAFSKKHFFIVTKSALKTTGTVWIETGSVMYMCLLNTRCCIFLHWPYHWCLSYIMAMPFSEYSTIIHSKALSIVEIYVSWWKTWQHLFMYVSILRQLTWLSRLHFWFIVSVYTPFQQLGWYLNFLHCLWKIYYSNRGR